MTRRDTNIGSRTETVTVRLSPEMLKASHIVAAAEFRSTSSLLQVALHSYILQRHPAALEPGAKIKIDIVKADA